MDIQLALILIAAYFLFSVITQTQTVYDFFTYNGRVTILTEEEYVRQSIDRNHYAVILVKDNDISYYLKAPLFFTHVKKNTQRSIVRVASFEEGVALSKSFNFELT